MKSFQEQMKLAVVALTTLALVAGCSSTKSQARRAQPAPVVNIPETTQGTAMGGTGTSYGSQAGAGQGGAMAGQQSTNLVIPLHQEQLNVGTRQVNEGAVQLRKTVRTETVSQPVQVRRETVTVERQPGSAAAGTAQMSQGTGTAQGAQGAQGTQGAQGAQGTAGLTTPFQQGEMTINLTREEPFAQTQVVQDGSVVVRKQVTTEPVNIQRQVRREEIQAVPIGNPQNVNISGDLTSSAPGTAANTGSAAGTTDQGAAGAGPSMSGQTAGAGGSSAPITQLNQLTSTSDPTTLAGRQVNVSNAKVQQVVGDRLLAVDSGSGTPIYVKTADSTSNIKSGQTINLTGTVKGVPQSTSDLGLDQTSAQQLQGQPIYVEAIRVTLIPQTPQIPQ
jgi:stress response protein YsnF